MKFRGLMNDLSAMREFMNVAVILSKLSKTCVLRITSKKLYFIITEEDAGPKRPIVWMELPVNYYFNEYNLVGVHPEHNEIFLELSTGLLSRSLSIVKQEVKCMKVKLTNKESPCLTLEMEMLAEDNSRQVVHDIPVEVISRKHWSDYEEPHFDDFHASIKIPNIKSIKNIVDKMKSLSHMLSLTANKEGRLTLQIKSTMVNLSATVPDLSLESFVGQRIPNLVSDKDDLETVTATVDIKKFLMFLSGMQLNNCSTICSIINEKMVKFTMEQPGSLLLQLFLTEYQD